MSFELLSEPIRKYIREKRWDSLRPIQVAAISRIIGTDSNYILASRTASGKTEAAFLPILSKVNFNEKGAQVLYISPLIALINDQFTRVENLCKNLDVEVTKWHGEASKSEKNKLVANPRGIVLITPESLEAMFVNAPYNVKELFGNLKYLVVDEIHSFIGTDRGIQLKSLISRLQQINSASFNIIGLSATIGDFNEAKRMTGDEANTKVLLDKTAKEITANFYFFESDKMELPDTLLDDLYGKTKNAKVLIFPNSRGRAEEIAVKLQKISKREKGHAFYFSHHSSVDRELREYIEYFAKNNQRNNFCIACTSTLELGIDIGTVDQVVQIDATSSISSLIQRVGRSGRREGEKSSLLLYATDEWSLLQSLSCWILYQEGFIEPSITSEKPYDILLHQILSIVKQNSGCKHKDLREKIHLNFAFRNISADDVEIILAELVRLDFLELLQDEYIIGIEGEKIVNSRDFYTVFKTEPNLKVVNAGKTIGEIPFSPQVKINENILLAARIWKIIDVDPKSKRIEVAPARDGKKPLFFGRAGMVHSRIRQKMLEVLLNSVEYCELDELSTTALNTIRKEFSIYPIEIIDDDRPLLHKAGETLWFTFQSTKVNRSLHFLLDKAGINCVLDDHSSCLELPLDCPRLSILKDGLYKVLDEIDFHLENIIRLNPSIMEFSKWGVFLPIQYQILLLKERYFDFDQTKAFIDKVNFIEPSAS
ncbi:MAG: DEAD/DEAH box helicase [Bacteroidetes bacterium]|nr:DEAD/DEAH box helicase [Bacteroidota bacterium]